MEEEIITPEEETFEYNKLRYILGKDGYVCHASLGGLIICDLGTCTEYNGEIPEGYETLEKWYDTQINENKLNAWKIVDGNLVYDENHYNKLQVQYEIDNENNSCATHKWVNDKLNKSTTIYDDNFSVETTEQYITNSNDSEIPEIIIKGNGSLTEAKGSSIYIDDAKTNELKELTIEGKSEQETRSGKNKFNINLVESSSLNGITLTKNENGTITLNGTTTSATTFTIGYKINANDEIVQTGDLNIKNISGTMSTKIISGSINHSASSTGLLEFNLCDSEGNNAIQSTTKKQIGKIVQTTGSLDASITYNWADITIPNSVTCDNLVLGLQVEQGEETEWEQYGASPSPDYPSEIKTIPSIRNLLTFGNDTNVKNGVTYILNNNGFIVNGTTTSSGATFLISFGIIKAGTYTIQSLLESGSFTTPDNYTFGTYIRDNTKSLVSITNKSFKSAKTFTINEDKELFYQLYVNGAGVTFNNCIVKVQLKKGTVAHDIVPYGSWARVKITGKNLFNKDKVSIGYLKEDGTLSNDNAYYTSDFISVLPNSTYYKSNTSSPRTKFFDKNKKPLNTTTYQDLSLGANEGQFIIPENAYFFRFSYSPVYIDVNTIQIEKGTTVTKCEAYKEKEVLIDLSKPNLFNKELITSTTLNGITFTNNNDGTLTLNGTATRGFSYKPTFNNFTLKAGIYTHLIKNELNSGLYLSLDEISTTMLNGSKGNNKAIFSLTNDTTFSKYVMWIDNGTVFDNYIITPTIYEGYTDYYELSSIGDIKDELSIIDGQVVIDEKIGKIVLDGSEGWTKSGITANQSYYCNLSLDINKTKISQTYLENIVAPSISTYFRSISPNTLLNNSIQGFSFNVNGSYITLRLGFGLDSSISSVDLLKTWLSNNQVTVYYELEEPQQIILPNTNIPLFEGVNHISLVDDLETNITCTYTSQTTRFEDGLKIHVTNENVLINEAINSTLNGLAMTVNDDKSISINGTATADTEFILNGSIDNIDPIFMLNNSNQFTVSGLNEKVSLNLYNYNGTDKELVYSGTGGNIVLGQPKYITCSTLQVANGTTVDITINPSIILNGGDYVEPKANTFITTEPFELKQNEHIKVDRSYIKVIGEDETTLKVIEPLRTFNPNTLIQTNSNDVSLTTKYFTNDYINERVSKIEKDQDNIRLEVSKTYSTKEETVTAKQEAIESANSSTDDKLKDYSTTTEMKAAINVSANAINQTASATYSTKEETANAKTEAINSANASTDTKLKDYSTTVEMNSAIAQKVSESEASINLEVAKKVNNDDFTGANILLKVNNDTSEAKIKANKIGLEGYTTINGGFNIDTSGNTTIKGGRIELNANDSTDWFRINGSDGNSFLKLHSDSILIKNSSLDQIFNFGNISIDGYQGGYLWLGNGNSTQTVIIYNGMVNAREVYADERITAGNIDNGRCTLTSAGDRTIYFNNTFPSVPNVVLTPITTTNGVIAAKITEITTTYFKANIGGTNFGDNQFCWIAISD